MSSSEAPSSLSSFVSTHRRTLVICAVAAVVAGLSLYLVSSPSSSSSTKKSRKPRKEKESSKKKSTVKDDNGPILEEIVKPASDDPAEQAAALKAEGNAAYKAQDYKTAVELYTKAIEVSPKEEAVFYSNRAACYMNLSPPNYDLAIADCTSALALTPTYIKALNRRATAYESTEQYQLALNDFTATTFLQKFSDPSSATSVERVLKKLSESKAEEIINERKKDVKLPSHTFVAAYFAAFRERERPHVPEENPSQGDLTLDLAFGALDSGDYAHSLSLVNEALEQGISTDKSKAEALNLRGTFNFLLGQVDSSKSDFLESLKLVPTYTQSLVKLASVYMEQADPIKAFECFDEAISHNADDPDIYYHRGQVLFITSQFAEASQNYSKSTSLDSNFVFSHIQHAVAEYKTGSVAKSMHLFKRILEDPRWSGRSEGFNYFGELLLDQGKFPEAIEKFDRAIQIEKAKPSLKNSPPNVLPLVNKALAIYQSTGDYSAATALCQEALSLDETCDAAISSLAQFNLQHASMNPGSPKEAKEMILKALGYLDKQVEMARTKEEVMGVLQYRYASEAQLVFQEKFPDVAKELAGMARGM